MGKKYNHLAFTLSLAMSIVSCGSTSTDPELNEPFVCNAVNPTAYTFNLPDHIPDFIEPANNLATNEGVQLGRRLYYDTQLSKGGPLEGHACASCHLQSANFSNNQNGISVMPHTNMHWSNFWLWNGAKSGGIEDVMLFEVTDFFQTNIDSLNSDRTYQELNCNAFGRADITTADITYALSQWVRTLVSYQSKYDRYLQGEVELTEEELVGMEIFTTNKGHCFKCHTLPQTTDHSFHNNGLDLVREGVNAGRYNVTGDPADKGWFKTPSLRNVELTAPYMHDGRFASLAEVIEFYERQVFTTDTLDPIFQEQLVGDVYSLNLHTSEKAALEAFLKTFTDQAFLTNPELSSPFD